jgi:transposase-like protein
MKRRLSRLDLVRSDLRQFLKEGLDPAVEIGPWLMERCLQLVIQAALEQEVNDFRGRMRYGRGPLLNRGLRNGYEPKRLKTDYGIIVFDVPQLRETEAPYRSAIAAAARNLRPRLEHLADQLYAQPITAKEVSATFPKLLSPESARTLAALLTEEYEALKATPPIEGLVHKTQPLHRLTATYGVNPSGRQFLIAVPTTS